MFLQNFLSYILYWSDWQHLLPDPKQESWAPSVINPFFFLHVPYPVNPRFFHSIKSPFCWLSFSFLTQLPPCYLRSPSPLNLNSCSRLWMDPICSFLIYCLCYSQSDPSKTQIWSISPCLKPFTTHHCLRIKLKLFIGFWKAIYNQVLVHPSSVIPDHYNSPNFFECYGPTNYAIYSFVILHSYFRALYIHCYL